MTNFLQDLRYGIRMLSKSPGFTAVAVLSLALGIGASASIFSFVDALLLRPLPVKEPGQLVSIFTKSKQYTRDRSSYPDYVDYRAQNHVFAGLAVYRLFPFSMSADGRPEVVWGNIVSGNYFSTLGVGTTVGRTFLPEEDDAPGVHKVAMLGHGLWQRRFGSDPGVIGKRVRLNGEDFTVVGVAARHFRGTERFMSCDLWVPAAAFLPRAGAELRERGVGSFSMIGRLKPGVSEKQAQAELDSLSRQLAQAYPKTNEGRSAVVLSESRASSAGAASFSVLLLAMVGLILLIPCANLANLLLARAQTRRREIALRQALGAGRLRLFRQLLTESLLLALLGGAAGLMVAYWAVGSLPALLPVTQWPIGFDFRMDTRVFLFTSALTVLSALLFGLAPALRTSRPDLIPALKSDTGAVGRSRRFSVRNVLVVGQVAVSLIVLSGAGLMVRTFWKFQAMDPGFQVKDMLLVSLIPALNRYEPVKSRALFEQLQKRVQALPGVTGVTLARLMPLGLDGSAIEVEIEGAPPSPGKSPQIGFNTVALDYFRMMGTPILRGRDFNSRDNFSGPRVALVNETLARRFPGGDPLGRRLRLVGPRGVDLEVVGVVRDGKYRKLTEEPRPFLYLAWGQRHEEQMTFLIQTAGNPRALAGPVRRELQALDKDLPVYDLMTMQEHMRIPLLEPRLTSGLVGGLGLLGLLLAMIGLYGVVSYFVNRRSREFGIRMALGAGRGDVFRLVLRQGLSLVLVGTGIGLAAAFPLARLIASELYGVGPSDPVTFTAVPLLLAAVGALACYLPARRATRVDPITALRYE